MIARIWSLCLRPCPEPSVYDCFFNRRGIKNKFRAWNGALPLSWQTEK